MERQTFVPLFLFRLRSFRSCGRFFYLRQSPRGSIFLPSGGEQAAALMNVSFAVKSW